MKVAVVRNRKKEGILFRFGRPGPETYGKKSVQRVMDALRAAGHDIKVLEGDMTLFSRLKKFIPPDENGRPTGLVFNMSYGIQGDCRYTHLPAMLEMAGVPYTGASPVGHSLSLDKVVTKQILQSAGIPTPKMAVMSRPDPTAVENLRFPLVVKPRHESTSCGLHLVHNHEEMISAVLSVTGQFEQEALVEEYIPGRELCIGILGNDEPEVLPFVELDFNGREHSMLTREDKFHRTQDEPQKVCPVQLSPELEERIKKIAAQTFRLCHCRDYARVDLRLDPFGNPYVLEINSMASLGQGGTFVMGARQSGYSFVDVIDKIVEIACQRYELQTHENKTRFLPVFEQSQINQVMQAAA
ncbi:MAG: ATP-grasp domain-containing protein [bacterium]